MIDYAGCNFVITRQAYEYGQAGSIRRRPCVWALVVNSHVPDAGLIGAPFPILYAPIEEFIEPTAILVEHQHMAVASARLWVAFDQGVRGNRFGSRITFIKI